MLTTWHSFLTIHSCNNLSVLIIFYQSMHMLNEMQSKKKRHKLKIWSRDNCSTLIIATKLHSAYTALKWRKRIKKCGSFWLLVWLSLICIAKVAPTVRSIERGEWVQENHHALFIYVPNVNYTVLFMQCIAQLTTLPLFQTIKYTITLPFTCYLRMGSIDNLFFFLLKQNRLLNAIWFLLLFFTFT